MNSNEPNIEGYLYTVRWVINNKYTDDYARKFINDAKIQFNIPDDFISNFNKYLEKPLKDYINIKGMTESEILNFLKNINGISIKPYEEPEHEKIPDITEFSGLVVLKNDQEEQSQIDKSNIITVFLNKMINIDFDKKIALIFALLIICCILYNSIKLI